MNTKTFAQPASDYQRVEQALRFLETNFRTHPSLDEIAASPHLSKYHFQRLFKRWVGISPSQFLQFLTIEYTKQKLRDSKSILDVTLDAGLSSPGRLHDLYVTFEAITPGEYKQKGVGLEIKYGFHDTPFGQCLLATTKRGICSLYFGGQAALDELETHWPNAVFVEDSNKTQPLVNQVFEPAQADPARPFHLLLKGTNFQVNVWRALLAIPPGAMLCYKDVAKLIGRPQAVRAVANAVARNPISYLIPCHRVITKSGQIHRYRWGAVRKKAILGWEASQEVGVPAGA